MFDSTRAVIIALLRSCTSRAIRARNSPAIGGAIGSGASVSNNRATMFTRTARNATMTITKATTRTLGAAAASTKGVKGYIKDRSRRLTTTTILSESYAVGDVK